MSSLFANRNYPNSNGWQDRHDHAIHMPVGDETPIVELCQGFARYARHYQQKYDSLIGEDGALGGSWKAIGEGILGLLDGPTGRLDCGTVDSFVRDTLAEHGAPTDE